MSISQLIYGFIHQAIDDQLLEAIDELYVRNRLLALFNQSEYRDEAESGDRRPLLDWLDDLVEYGVTHQIIDDTQSDRDILEASVMDLLMPKPSDLNHEFWHLYAENPEVATDYFYQLSKQSNYIKTREIAKNVAFTGETKYGNLQITINLSKPEKDPVEIAKAKSMPQVNYPKCALCMENEGYRGHINHAARQNHRIIRMDLDNGLYGFQYSPYLYYNEHSIFLSDKHEPMVIDLKCFDNLLEIIEIFPHYFVGSNADLPGVGGSILTHDHYQGGRQVFPMDQAEVIDVVAVNHHDEVECELLKWPMSVIRLRSADKDQLLDAANQILQAWRQYDDPDNDVYAETDQPHNTVTPIARRKGEQFELDLVLRNNRTTEELPLGIFHPHPDVHHIKKENIGLIEVMGLAILPPRLLAEVETIKQYLLGEVALDEVKVYHQTWAESLKADYADDVEVSDFIQQGIVKKFERVLEDAGVYKQTEQGLTGLKQFIESVDL